MAAIGLGGLLISSSFGVFGVCVPLGVGGMDGPVDMFSSSC